MAMADVAKRLTHLADAESGGVADADYLLRRRTLPFLMSIGTASLRYQLTRADKAFKIISASLSPSATYAADNTNNVTLALRKHDGAGGSATASSASRQSNVAGGAITASQKTAFTINTDGTEDLAAGDWLELNVTVAGTVTATQVAVEVVIEYK